MATGHAPSVSPTHQLQLRSPPSCPLLRSPWPSFCSIRPSSFPPQGSSRIVTWNTIFPPGLCMADHFTSFRLQLKFHFHRESSDQLTPRSLTHHVSSNILFIFSTVLRTVGVTCLSEPVHPKSGSSPQALPSVRSPSHPWY